jgi:hypothetical protein
MKTITIRLPDVEAAMLVELQKVDKAYRDLQGLLINQIQTEYQKTPKGRASRQSPTALIKCPAHHAACLRGIHFTSRLDVTAVSF